MDESETEDSKQKVKVKLSLHSRFLMVAIFGFLLMVVSITLLTCVPMYSIINQKFFNIGNLEK
jgi:uncharacterized protein YqhQ